VEIGTITGILSIVVTLLSLQYFMFRSVWKIKGTVDNSLTKDDAAELYLSKVEAKSTWHDIANDSVELDNKYVTGVECEKYRHCMLQQIDKKATDSSSLFMKTVNDILHNSNSLMQKMADIEKALIQNKERREADEKHRNVMDKIQEEALKGMMTALEKVNSNLDEMNKVVYHLNEQSNSRKVA
jgi:hypothetical protein